MRPTLLISLLSMALLVASCTPGPLEGDWFQCADEVCSTLDDDGVRFTADGRWGALNAQGGELEPGGAYELEGPRGTYSLDGETLTLRVDGTGESMSVRISFDGDDLLIHDVEVAVTCAQPAPPPGGTAPPPACEEQPERKTVRFRRVADAGEVPAGGGAVFEDDRVTTAPPVSGGSK